MKKLVGILLAFVLATSCLAFSACQPPQKPPKKHTHFECDLCALCTDENCNGSESEKCKGHLPDVLPSKYTQIADLLVEQCTKVGEIRITQVFLIDIDANDRLIWWARRGDDGQVCKFKFNRPLNLGTTEEENCAEIATKLYLEYDKDRFVLFDAYHNEKTMTTKDGADAPLLTALARKLVGDSYQILYAGASHPVAMGHRADVGNYSIFSLDLLLLKDGVISEYSTSIIANNDGSPYDAVIAGTEATNTTNGSFKTAPTITQFNDTALYFYNTVYKNN